MVEESGIGLSAYLRAIPTIAAHGRPTALPSAAPGAPGSVDRPVNSRMYRGTWLFVGIPLLIAAFTVSRPQPLPAPDLPPDFDGAAARVVARDFANQFPDRTPGSPTANATASWVAEQLSQYGFRTEFDRFHGKIPGRGQVQLENLLAFRQGRSNDVIAVIAHRDNSGAGPGANDNASAPRRCSSSRVSTRRRRCRPPARANSHDPVPFDRRRRLRWPRRRALRGALALPEPRRRRDQPRLDRGRRTSASRCRS